MLTYDMPSFVCALVLVLFSVGAQSKDVTEAMPTGEVQSRNTQPDINGVARINEFTGDLSSYSRDVFVPTNGGSGLAVHRRYVGARVRAHAWDGHFKYGVTTTRFLAQERAALGRANPGWTLTVAPHVTVSVAKRWHEELPLHMTDDLDKVCTGQPFRYENGGTTGAYGTVIVYALTLPDGGDEVLVPTKTGEVVSPGGWRLTCTGKSGTHILHAPNGDKYTLGKRIYNENVEVVDDFGWATLNLAATRKDEVNGGWVNFSYENYGPMNRPQVSKMESQDGVTLSFSYKSYDVLGTNEYRLDTVNSGSGGKWSYQYNADGQLSGFTDAVGRQWEYDYVAKVPYNNLLGLWGNSSGAGSLHAQPEWAKSGHLKAITVPTGGKISFHYEVSEVWGRGVWWWEGMSPEAMVEFAYNNSYESYGEILDVRANWSVRVAKKIHSDGAIWTYAYAPSKQKGQYDITTVQTPDGPEIHKFFGEGYFGDTNLWGDLKANGVYYYQWGSKAGSGPETKPIIRDVWRLGLLAEIKRGNSYSEKYEWAPLVHSNIFFVATSGFVGMRDEKTYKAVIAKKEVAENGVSYLAEYQQYDEYGNAGVVLESTSGGGGRRRTRFFDVDASKNIRHRLESESVSVVD